MSIETKVKGKWDKEFYMVDIGGGYARCAAIKRGTEEEITPFGHTLLADMSADVVPSQEPKKRGRKAKVEEVPDLDELDI